MANVIDKVAGLVVGPQGPQGPQGPKGDTGQTGPQGAQGATGATPNLTMGTVTTLEPDSQATATITGTAENPVLNLGLPKGRTGEVSQAEFDEVAGDVTKLKSELKQIAGSEKIIFTTGYYIKTVGTAGSTVVDLTPQANGSLAYAIVPCSEGDKLIINGLGWTNGRLWAFLDSNNVLLSVEQANITGVNLVITAPPNTAKCVLNSFVSRLGDCFKGLTVPVYAKQTDASISGIESQICNVYHRYEQGTINSQGTPVANANTMRSIDFVPLENIKYIKIGVNNYIYLRLYDMYGYYVGMISSLVYGQGYPEFITYDSIKASYPNAYNLKITIHGSSAVTPSTLANTGLEMVYYKTLPQTVIVDINGSGDYTSILKALKETPPTTRIYVKKGTYNEITEYTDYYGSDFWTNYAGYGGLQDDFLRGYFVSAGRVLEFESGAVVECLFDGTNTNISQYFCPLATGYDATIIGGYIKYSHCRYGLHDDHAIQGGTNVFDGIIFDGTDIYYGNHIGGGMGKANTYYLKNLVFIDDGLLENNGDLYYHNNLDASAENRLFMSNCYGNKSATFMWYGNSTKITRCIACGNHFKDITCQAHTIAPYDNENVKLIAFNNDLLT